MRDPTTYDHLRPAADPEAVRERGVYRVVGTEDDRVTLLRVTDADGRRAHTGEVVIVDAADLTAFEPAENPDGGRSLAARLGSLPETAYWSARAFGQQLVANPRAAGVALAIVAVGLAVDALPQMPDLIAGVLLFLGSIGLAYVGGGRL